MNKHFTPSTVQVRATYSYADGDQFAEYRKVSFDQWLAEHDREVTAEGFRQGWFAVSVEHVDGEDINPVNGKSLAPNLAVVLP